MNAHKFNAKPKTIPPKTIQWLLQEARYPARNSTTWEIISQEEMKLK